LGKGFVGSFTGFSDRIKAKGEDANLLFVQLPIGPFLMGTYLAAYGVASYLVVKGGLTARIIKALIVVLPALLIFGVLDWQTSDELSRGVAWLSKLPPHAMGVLIGIIIGERWGAS